MSFSMFLSNPEQIAKAIKQQPFDTTGNRWQPEQVIELLKQGQNRKLCTRRRKILYSSDYDSTNLFKLLSKDSICLRLAGFDQIFLFRDNFP